jgi:hypothetical protein
MFVDGVGNRGMAGPVPGGAIGLLSLLMLLLCLSTFDVCVFGEPFSQIGFGRSAPSLGAPLDVLERVKKKPPE